MELPWGLPASFHTLVNKRWREVANKNHPRAAGLWNHVNSFLSLLEALLALTLKADSWNRCKSLDQKLFGNVPVLCRLNL